MTIGKVAVFAAGAVVGGLIGYAALRSDAVKNVTKSTIKAGIKARDWTVDTFEKATNEVKEMVRDAKAEAAVEAEA